ncbi:uncharacterized protein LOC123557644 isoform X2 [Mercenaria mercenaria]|uniref:uncharacterized protein LOC123557644 isoform X2 n=1 Tax=Mercenaria mercenaria TaxID=6596 RepID=UPI00234F050A|nr:uncharacterized protein LOC123557644 isoform X2 [Mercenaria mercenaria]
MAAEFYSHKLSESKFKNWIKAGLGVLFTKEGIEPFVYDEIEQFQKKCLSDICNNNGLAASTTCSSCCTENVVVCPTDRICNVGRGKCSFHRNTATLYRLSGCPKNICHHFKNEIQNAHRFYGPSYKNTDATQWCSNPWEVAKCFMPPEGYKDVMAAAETDFNGINSVIINYKSFQSKVHDDLSRRNNIFDKAREVEKAVRHSSHLGMEDEDLQQYFSILQNVLSDPGYLASNSTSQNAKKKLSQLQNDTSVIGIGDIRKMLDDVAKAVEDELRTEKDDHKKKTEKLKLELIKITNKYVSAFKRQEKLSMSELDKVLQSAVDEMGVHTKKSIIEDHSTQKKHQHESEGLSFPDALKYKPREEKGTDANPELQAEEVISVRLKEHEEVTESADHEKLETFKTYIDKARRKLVVYMIPDPVLDCFLEDKLFDFQETRDIWEERYTTEKNRKILDKVRSKGEFCYDNLKKCLIKTKQKLLVEMLECIENGKDTSILEKQLQDKAVKTQSKVIKGTNPELQALEDAYIQRKHHLKEDLIDLYRKRHHTLPLSPLFEENDTRLLEFYVMPDINSVEIQKSPGGCQEVRSKVTSLHDVFYKESEPCHEIYLTADAGFGKTALSKRLVLTWCQAKKCIQNEEEYFKIEAVNAMSKFEFVFLLSLRDCSEEWDIDEMIIKQIIKDLAHTSITISDLETILSKEKCLVILDGLDEWTPTKPACKQRNCDIPHRKARECTILTTTRPWKLGVSKIRSSEIERKLELVGLSKTSARSLKRSVISLMRGETDIEKHIQNFDRAVSDRGISDLETIPLLLMYLLCLWCDGIELGKSKTELYCQIVELLLKRTFEKSTHMQRSREHTQSDIPQCFSEHEHCKEHNTLLKALGKLAFETLFTENKESTLVFNQSMTDKHLTSENLKLSLDSGILTQSTEKTLTKQISKFSFSHKTVQEFFCALYISCQSESDIKKIVLQKCRSLQSILDMSTVFVFISGLNAEIISSISRELMSVINEDKITSKYRSTTDRDCNPLKDIQDMYISCIKENTSYKELEFFCQDFFFSGDCKEKNYFSHLSWLAVHNKNNMQSININIYGTHSLHEIIDSCELHEPFNINKIFYCGIGEEVQLPLLLKRSTKCVTVLSLYQWPLGSWNREMSETLQNNSSLQAIYIHGFVMNHDILNDFLNYIINIKTMTEIGIGNLSCTEHDRSCTFGLDFCQHSDLRALELFQIPEVSKLKVSSQVKHVKLDSINLGEMSLPPEMVNIERVELNRVNISASTFRDIIKVVEKLSHTFTVKIDSCNIEPETEFEDLKQYIHSSQNFRVTRDERRLQEFVFETKVESQVTQ